MQLDEKNKKVFKAVKFKGPHSENVNDQIVVEEALQININGKPFTVTMRTPGSDLHLIRGLLFTEGIYTGESSLKSQVLEYNEDHVPISINLQISPKHIGGKYYQSRSMLSVSSCGICGKKELEDLILSGKPIRNLDKLNIDRLPQYFETMKMHQSVFHETGGSHAAACFDNDGKLLVIEEDIGRHNAVDKIVGSLLEKNTLDSASCLLVSGRVSFEIISKCFKAGIPYLAAVSSPSSLSIETANAMGICLLAFCRGENITCYTHADRITSKTLQITH